MRLSPKIAEEVRNFLEGREEQMLELLKDLVRKESPSGDKEALQEIVELLQKEFQKLNFWTFRSKPEHSGGFLYARPHVRNKNAPVQLILGHCDTVWELNTLKKMPLQEEKEVIKGPGIYDMKAGLVQMIFCLKALKNISLSPEVIPLFLINTDEEVGSKESTRAIARLAKIADRAFVLEPPLGLEGKLKTARKGVGRFTVKVQGKASHAGLDPEKGVNAIVELSQQVQKLYAMNDPEKGITVNVGMISGGVSPNVVAPESSAVIDVRVLNPVDAEYITQKIRDLEPFDPDVKLVIEGEIGRAPMEKNQRNQELWERAKKGGDLLDLELNEATAGGGSDGNTTSLYTATLDGLGTTGDGAHALHEYIIKEKLLERTALLVILLLQKPLTKVNK